MTDGVGPFHNCQDCGHAMVWGGLVWMCPRCTERRLRRATFLLGKCREAMGRDVPDYLAELAHHVDAFTQPAEDDRAEPGRTPRKAKPSVEDAPREQEPDAATVERVARAVVDYLIETEHIECGDNEMLASCYCAAEIAAIEAMKGGQP